MTENLKVRRSQMFFCKLIPNRATFPADMTPEEAAIMGKHVEYWTGLLLAGKVLGFGPVSDPAGAYGAGIVNVTDDAAMNDLCANDPAVTSGLNRAEYYPMQVVHGEL